MAHAVLITLISPLLFVNLQVFTSIALFNMLIFPLNVFPWVINGLIEAWVSLNRVNRFLMLEELDWQEFYSSNIGADEKESGAMVVIVNGGFTWNTDESASCEKSVENNDMEHSNDLLKRSGSFGNAAKGANDLTIASHTQTLKNINLSVYQVWN